MSEIQVLSRTQRIVIDSSAGIRVVTAGAGPPGPPGPAGATGPAGANGTNGVDGDSGMAALPIRGGGLFFYTTPYGVGQGSAHVAGTEYAFPFYVSEDTTYSKIAVMAPSGVAGSSVRLGIYEDAGGRPGALLIEAGSVATTAGGIPSIVFAPAQVLTKGWYWLACAVQGGNSNLWRSTSPCGLAPTTSPFSYGAVHGYSRTGVTGALPNPWGSTVTDQINCPIVWLVPQ